MRILFLVLSIGFLISCSSGEAVMEKKQDNPVSAASNDWPSWRGIDQTGYSAETGLVESWSKDGENLIWRQDFTGRSTPVILNGKVYVIGRTGTEKTQQEVVACYDARTGRKIWEHLEPVRNTYAPFSRTGWACMVGDAETGNVYSVGTAGIFNCFSGDGKLLWTRSMIEEFGARTGYGGRTTNPVIDEDRVIVGFVSAGWGEDKPMKGRHFAFNKYDGTHIWTASPGGIFKAPNLYSNPVVSVIDGQRLFIAGNADGNIYAMKSRTGEKVWEFKLSQRGINSSVVVDGYRVYAAHGEENIDEPKMGRIVCFDGRGSGDITETNELWRYDAEIGYTSPLLHDGRVYYVDNASNMIALDAETGQAYWEFSLGTVGKGSPVWADGKIYVTETNGKMWILKPSAESCQVLDEEHIKMPDSPRDAEIYASPAIAYGRIYLVTEEGIYCIGDANRDFRIMPPQPIVAGQEPAVESDAAVSYIRVYPGEVVAGPGDNVTFTAHAYNARGQHLKKTAPKWEVPAAVGKINSDGKLTVAKSTNGTSGLIKASAGGVTGQGRIRVFPTIPWTEDFEGYENNDNPPHWIGVSTARSPAGRFIVKTDGNNKVLAKPTNVRGIQRHLAFIGTADMKDYVVQADVLDHKDKRRRGDAGLVAHGYTLDLQGKKQRLEIRSWASENRIRETVPFKWEPRTWHTLKLDVDIVDGKTVIRGKAWPTAQPEPAEWTVTAEDPLIIPTGSPALYGVSYTEVYFDNVKVMPDTD